MAEEGPARGQSPFALSFVSRIITSVPHLITPRILHDQPLDQLDDRAEFHFDDYANTFARLVTDRTTRTPLVILVCGCLIGAIGFGPRAALGLFLTPMSMEHQWSREVFSFALALQNLMWGATQPFAGWLADRYGARRVLWSASVLYALGLLGMAYSATGTGLSATAGLMIGAAQSGCTYSVVFAAMGKLVPDAVVVGLHDLGLVQGTAAHVTRQVLQHGAGAAVGTVITAWK